MSKFNNKEILSLNWITLDKESDLNRIWDKYRYWKKTESYFACTKDVIKNKITTISSINPGDTFYFGATSNFPRTKLKEFGYKRKLKPNAATYQVISDLCIHSVKIRLVEGDKYCFVIDDSYSRFHNSSERNAYEKDPIKYLIDHDLFPDTNIKEVINGECIAAEGKYAQDVEDILNGAFTNIITDKNLDILISNGLPDLTPDDIKSICELLDSPDNEAKTLGLKLLCGFNVGKYPLTVKTILGARPYLKDLNAFKGVMVENMMATLGFTISDSLFANIGRIIDSDFKYTDEDRELVRCLYVKQVEAQVQDTLSDTRIQKIINEFNIDINLEIQ